LAEAALIKGLLQAVLIYSEGNASAKHLYKACGFGPFGREPRATLMTNGTRVNKILWYEFWTAHTGWRALVRRRTCRIFWNSYVTRIIRPTALEEYYVAGKLSFTPDEWARVVASPLVAGMAITAADPSGLWGLLKEAFSGGRALLDAKQGATANPLARAIADDITTPETRTAARDRMQAQFKGVQLSELKSKAVDELRQVAAIVNSKAPEDAAGFKAWLQSVAQQAAEAGNEGGFLGFGGVAVSDAERATLGEISAALNSSDSPSSTAPAPES
jgi:hypothetical protein